MDDALPEIRDAWWKAYITRWTMWVLSWMVNTECAGNWVYERWWCYRHKMLKVLPFFFVVISICISVSSGFFSISFCCSRVCEQVVRRQILPWLRVVPSFLWFLKYKIFCGDFPIWIFFHPQFYHFDLGIQWTFWCHVTSSLTLTETTSV